VVYGRPVSWTLTPIDVEEHEDHPAIAERPGLAVPITSGRVNNSFDIQRRRQIRSNDFVPF